MSGAARRIVPFAVSAVAVAVVALAAHVLTRFVPLPHVSILFMAAVLTSAAIWGFWPAVFAAVLSVATSMYFFYSPIFDFRVADVQDVADLGVFVIVAALTSRLAASVRAQALEARRQQRNVAGLLAFSQRVAGITSQAELNAAVDAHLAAGSGDAEYEKALLGQAALAMERARMQREIDDTRIRMHGEALREALINSISHDLRTPLAAILGSATALESFGDHAEARTRRELTATIRQEAERLEAYIDNVLDLTRIRAGQIAPRLELVEIADIVNAALRRKHNSLAAHTVLVSLPPDLPMLRLDLFLMEHAIANVLDNAAKFSAAGSTIRIGARVHNDAVMLDIADEGPGISSEERAQVFEPFYRGARGAGGPAVGSGLGLAICRAFVTAHGGEVAAVEPERESGALVRLRLPLAQGAAEAGEEQADD